MHRPGALELACLLALGALAVIALLLARTRTPLRPLASGLLLLVVFEVARLFTRSTPLDRVLFVAWAGVTIAPAVAVVLADETPPRSSETGPRTSPPVSGAHPDVGAETPPRFASWVPHPFVVVVLAFVALGVLVASVSPVFRSPGLRPFWPAVLGGTRVLATAVTAYALAERMRRADRWVHLTCVELAALVLPIAQLSDVLTLWAFGAIGRWWIARVVALVTYAALGAILVLCSRSTVSTTPRSSPSG